MLGRKRLRLSWKVDECKPLPATSSGLCARSIGHTSITAATPSSFCHQGPVSHARHVIYNMVLNQCSPRHQPQSVPVRKAHWDIGPIERHLTSAHSVKLVRIRDPAIGQGLTNKLPTA